MTNRIELKWDIPYEVDEQHYYCSETPIDPENLPVPKVVLAGDVRTYVDTEIEIGKTYYVAVGSVKNGVEKISDEKLILFGKEWTPTTLTNSMYFDADSVVVVDGKVASISSKNGSHIFTQNTVNYRPVLVTNTLNNQPIMRFTKANKSNLSTENALDYLKNVSYAWVFAVYKRNDVATLATTNALFIASVNGSTSGRFSVYAGTSDSVANSNKFGFGVRGLDSQGSLSTAYGLASESTEWCMSLAYNNYTMANGQAFFNGSKVFDGALSTSGTTSNTPSSSMNIGMEGDTAYNDGHLNGDIAAIIIGNFELTESNRQKLEGWAAHKYGLTANLPAGHPYKILVPTL